MSLKIKHLQNEPGGQVINVDVMNRDINFTPNIQAKIWQHGETIVRQHGSANQLSEFHAMRRHVDAGDTSSARTIWIRIKPIFDAALAKGADIAQIVSTISGFLHHGS